METDEIVITDEKKETKSLETTVSSSSRPKRKLKPRNYSDEFYIYGDHGKCFGGSALLLPQQGKIHTNFATSSPVQKPKKHGRAGTQKAPVESIQSGNSIDSNKDCEMVSLTAQHTDTSQIETHTSEVIENLEQNSTKKSEICTSHSEPNEHNGSPDKKNMLWKSRGNGKCNTAKECVNKANENLMVSEKRESNEVPKKQHVQSKRRNIHSWENSGLKENVISDTERSEAPEINHHCIKSRSMLDEVGTESVDKVEDFVVAQEPESVKNDVVDEIKSSTVVDADITFEPHKRRRGRPPKTVKAPVAQVIQAGDPAESSVSPVSKETLISPLDGSVTPVSETKQRKRPSETSVTPVSQKRPRGRPPKSVSQEIHTESPCESSAVPVSQETQLGWPPELCGNLVTQRKRGRPPKYMSQMGRLPETSAIAISREISVKSSPDTSVGPMSQEVEMGRQSKISSAAMSRKRSVGRPSKIATARPEELVNASHLSSDVSEQHTGGASAKTCLLCEKQMSSQITLQRHMMTEHSLIWSKGCPQGYDDPYNIVKKVGHIDCQNCKKRFRFAQYYKHHKMWCGREDETATCDLCQHIVKAMWLQQHMAAHRTQEKKLAQEFELNEKRKNGEIIESDEGDGDGGEASTKSKRKAAKNAIKLMSSLNDGTEQEEASSNDGFTEETSDESSYEDDENDEEDAVRIKKKLKHKDRNSYSTVDSAINNIWMRVSDEGADLSTKERLRLLRKFYASHSEGRAFPDLSPRKDDWQPLTDSEKEKYMPVHDESLKFTFGSTEDTENENEEHSLKFAHTVSHNGKTYCYTGGPVWAVEWCPIPEGASHRQVLAISADITTDEPPDCATMISGPGLIQIWSAGSLENKINCYAEPIFEYAIAHDSGYIRSISWCCKGCFDVGAADNGCLKRQGLLAVGCSDGSVLIYCPPQPEELKCGMKSSERDVTISVLRPQPAMVLVPNSRRGCGPCLSVSWQQGGDCKYIVAGYGQGAVYLWDISATSPLLKVDSSTLRPTRCFVFHSVAVLSCSWNPRNPSVFVTVSFDANVCVWNAERPDQPLGFIKRLLQQMIPRSACWAGPMHNGFFTTVEKLKGYEETPVCFHGLSRAVLFSTHTSLTVQYHTACTWDVSFCPFYEILVTCDAVGKVKVMLLPMTDIRYRGTGKCSWRRIQVRSKDLYHTRLKRSVLLPSSQPQSLPAADSSDKLHLSTGNQQAQSNENHHKSTSVIIKKEPHSDETPHHVNESNRTVLAEPTSHFSEPLSCGANCDVTKADLANMQDNFISESGDTLAISVKEQDTSLTNSTEVNEHIKSNTSSSKDALINRQGSPLAMTFDSVLDSLLGRADQNPIRGSTSCAKSINVAGASTSTKPTDYSSTSSKNQCFESANKSFIPIRDGSCLEFSRCLDGLEDVPSTSQLGSKLDTQRDQAVSEELLHFHDFRMTKTGLKPDQPDSVTKPDLEVLGGSNSHAVYRVHLNPNPVCCLWLASGGQSGILRLDNLSSLVQPKF